MEFPEVIAALQGGRLFAGSGSLSRDERELRDAVLQGLRGSKDWSAAVGDAVASALLRALREGRRSLTDAELAQLPDADRRVAEAINTRLELWDEFEPVSSGRVFDHVAFPDGTLPSDRERRLRAAVQCGLETWARASLYPGTPPVSAVIEFRRRGRDGWGSWTAVSGAENIGLDARRLGSLRAHQQLLVPCVSNHVHAVAEGDQLRLEWECGEGALERLASADFRSPELTLYFDVSGVQRESRASALTEFSTLSLRPWSITTSEQRSGAVQQTLAVRAGLESTVEDPGEFAGPADLLSPQHTPFADRFLRLSLESLLATVRRDARRVSFSVDFPSPDLAASACRLLQGRLRLNHALFWNRIRQHYDRFSLQSAVDGLPLRAAGAERVGSPVVITCIDERSNVYADERWGGRFDPCHRFRSTVVGSGASYQLHLSFADPWVTYARLRHVRLLLPVEWPRESARGLTMVPQSQFLLDDAEVFVHEDSVEPALGERGSDEELLRREALALLPAYFSGRGTLPAGHAASILELKRLVLARMPMELRALLPSRLDLSEISVSSAVSMPAAAPRWTPPPKAVPVALVTIPVSGTGTLAPHDIDRLLGALARDVERRCVAGIRLSLKLHVLGEVRP
jgi:hypothetical protein